MTASVRIPTLRNTRRFLALSAALLISFTGVLAGNAAPATAAPGCPDVELLFARGTLETGAPVGVTGLVMAASLDQQLAGKSVRTSAVRYAASSNFNDRPAFVRSVVAGIKTTQAQIRAIARHCPSTKIVLGGYSQGAVVASYAVSDDVEIPAMYARYRSQAPQPLPADIAQHISAVVLFGTPSSHWIRELGAPPMRVGASYRAKTASFCAPGDNVCDGSRVGQPTAAHVLYSVNGMAVAGADFAARRSR
ncbi:MAG: cutinase family protein [Gordonia sp. (in: high G+C Gram-positive bacteria)]|uniref:cutinase family protein n=1 Tax=Gordonia sp. (in: high G+C Gram-positive bacteria) TaxID=84139 RepID=UPI003BB71132